MSIRVLLAEDSAYQRKIIAEMITSNEEIEVIDVAKNGREAIQKIGKHNPDVILLSSEPYPFKKKHIAEFKKVVPLSEIKLVDGKMFSWYGSYMLKAPDYLKQMF